MMCTRAMPKRICSGLCPEEKEERKAKNYETGIVPSRVRIRIFL